MDEKKTAVPFASIVGGGKPNKLKEGLVSLQGDLLLLLEHMKLISQLHRAKFVALKREGFTDAQALELCKVVF